MATYQVSTSAGLVTQLNTVVGGDIIELAGGNYSKFHYTTAKTFSPNVIIRSKSKANPANFNDGNTKKDGVAKTEGAFYMTNVSGITIEGVNFINTLTQNSDTYLGVGYPAGIGFKFGLGVGSSKAYVNGTHNPNGGNLILRNCIFSDWFRTMELGRLFNVLIEYCNFVRCGMDNIRCFDEIRGLELHHCYFGENRIDIRRSNEKWYPSGGKDRHPDQGMQTAVPFGYGKNGAVGGGDDVLLADASRDFYIHHNYLENVDHYAHSFFLFNERAQRGSHLGETGRYGYNLRIEWNYIESGHTNAIAVCGWRKLTSTDTLSISNNCIRSRPPNTYDDTPKINVYKGMGTLANKAVFNNNVVAGGIFENDNGNFDTCTFTNNLTSETLWPTGWAANGPTRDSVGVYAGDGQVIRPAPMAVEFTPPTIVASSTGNTGATDITSHSITLPTGQTVGDILIAIIACDGNPTLTANTGWTKLGQQSSSTDVTGAVFYKVLTSATNTLTITTSAAQQLSYVVHRVINGTAVSGSSSTGNSTNSNPPAHSPIITGDKDRLWIAARCGDSNVNPTEPPYLYSDMVTAAASGTNGANVASCFELFYTNTRDPDAFTSATEQWVCYTLCVEPKETGRVVYHGSFTGLVDIGDVETAYQSGVFKKMYTGIYTVPPTSPAFVSDTTKIKFSWLKKGLTNPKPMVLANPPLDSNGNQRWQMSADFPINKPSSVFTDAHRIHAVEAGENKLEELQAFYKKDSDTNASISTPYKRDLTSPAVTSTTLVPLKNDDWDFVETNLVTNVNRFSAKLRISTTSSVPQNIITKIEWSKDLTTWFPTVQNGYYTPDGQKLWELQPLTTGALDHTIQYGKQSSPIWIRYSVASSATASGASETFKTFMSPDSPVPLLDEKEFVKIGGGFAGIDGVPLFTVNTNRPNDVVGMPATPSYKDGIVTVRTPPAINGDTEYYSISYNKKRYKGVGTITFPFVPGKTFLTIKGVSPRDPDTNKRSSSRTLYFFIQEDD